MTESEQHTLVQLLQEKTGLIAAGNMAIRAALELMAQRGYVITPSKTKGLNMPPKNKPIGIGSKQVNNPSEKWATLRDFRDPSGRKPNSAGDYRPQREVNPTPVGGDKTSKSNANGST